MTIADPIAPELLRTQLEAIGQEAGAAVEQAATGPTTKLREGSQVLPLACCVGVMVAVRVAPAGTSPTTLAVALKLRSGCTSTTPTLTGPSPKICRIRAPLNLMLPCISTPAAAICPKRARTGAG